MNWAFTLRPEGSMSAGMPAARSSCRSFQLASGAASPWATSQTSGCGGAGSATPWRFEGDEQAFDAAAEADAGRGAAAEVFDEVVVAAAAADGVLRAEAAGGDFPERVGVVVEAADEVGVDA